MFLLLFIITIILIIAPIITFICHIIKKSKFCTFCHNIPIVNKEFCIDKILFSDYRKDNSKRNAILLFFFILIVLITFILNTYNILLSEKMTTSEYSLHKFIDTAKINYKYFFIPLDLLIILSYISSFLINKFIEKIFPLKDGIDLNSNEHNTIVRFGTFCELIKNLNIDKIKPTTIKIGKEFGEKLEVQHLNLKKEEDLKILENKWGKTDSGLARFYEKIIIKQLNSSEIQLEIVDPFWNKNFHSNCKIPIEEYPLKKNQAPTKCLHPLCAFNYHYIEGILTQIKDFENYSLSIKCLEGNKKNRICYLKTDDKRCLFIIKRK